MKTYQEILQHISDKGYRLTKTRKGILDLLWKKHKPLSAIDIQSALKQRKNPVNKTTVYRELEFLVREKLAEEMVMNDGKRYYEVVSEHHHHLICVQCKSIDDVVLENEFEREEALIERDAGFKVLNHSLEFFGLCEQCR